MFNPTSIDEVSVQATHLEARGKNVNLEIGGSSKPATSKNKEKKKQKWKERKANAVQKDKPSCTHCKKDVHDDAHCWSLHLKLKPKKFDGKKKKIAAVVQKDLGSDLGDEITATATGIKGKNSKASTSNYAQSIDNDENERKRHEIFHIRVISKHQKIDTLFDSGSQINLISEATVKKLGLLTTPHKKPYPLGWVCDKANLQVTRQCKLRFAIGSVFIDEVELDIVPLDICGIVLGSTYLYDRKVIFYRAENNYQLTKDGIEYIEKNPDKTNVFDGCDAKQKADLEKVVSEYDILFQEPKDLPPKREIVHDIHLQQDAPWPNIGMYRLSALGNAEIKKQVQELLEKGFIRPSTSPRGSPIVLLRKKDGSWRMCIDYRALNKITIKNRYPLPRIDDLIDQLKEAIYFSKLDLHSGYHQVRVTEQDAWKIAFKTKQRLYEWLVMPFGLTNAPATFMRVMNDVLRPFIDDFVIVYLDDSLVFRGGELKLDPSKVEVIVNWPKPKSATEVRSFLGAAQYWRKFIANFSLIAAPLHALTGLNKVFQWGGKQ
eukprot:PITA_02220